MTDPSGLRVIEALCPAVSRHRSVCPAAYAPRLIDPSEPPNEWRFVETYDSLPTYWNPSMFAWPTTKTIRADQLCPVCGYKMEDGPRDYNICPSCGTEFGLHDVNSSIQNLQQLWIEGGLHWHSRVIPQPHAWNPQEQLLAIPAGPESYARADESSGYYYYAPCPHCIHSPHAERCSAEIIDPLDGRVHLCPCESA